MGAIYLIRHGQASFGAANYDQLSELGKRQASLLGASLAQRVSASGPVLTGTMVRHRQTAECCLEAMGRTPEYVRDQGWDEYDFSEVIIRHAPQYQEPQRLQREMAARPDPEAAFQQLFAAAVDRWIGGRHDEDYSETWDAFRSRCVAALERLATSLLNGENALVFTSGGPIGAIAQHSLNIPKGHIFTLNWSLANCGVTKLIHGGAGLHLSTLNDHSAFEGNGSELITYR